MEDRDEYIEKWPSHNREGRAISRKFKCPNIELRRSLWRFLHNEIKNFKEFEDNLKHSQRFPSPPNNLEKRISKENIPPSSKKKQTFSSPLHLLNLSTQMRSLLQWPQLENHSLSTFPPLPLRSTISRGHKKYLNAHNQGV